MKIKKECSQVQKENNQLNIEIQKYWQYFQDFDQKYKMQHYVKRRPKRKRIQYYDIKNTILEYNITPILQK